MTGYERDERDERSDMIREDRLDESRADLEAAIASIDAVCEQWADDNPLFVVVGGKQYPLDPDGRLGPELGGEG